MFKNTHTPPESITDSRQIRFMAIDLLARREHSCAELETKLTRKGAIAERVAEVLDALAAEGLQSDKRYSEAFISARARKGYGPVRVRMELKQKKISDDLIRAGLDNTSIDWFAIAVESWQKKFGCVASDMKEKSRQYRFLQYRGFTSDQINYALSAEASDDY